MNKKISTLPSADAIDGSELVPIVQSGATKQTTISELRPYKVYSALLTQSGTDAPTAIVLENTIGEIVWSYNDIGDYTGTLVGAFNINKVFSIVENSIIGINLFIIANTTNDTINLQSCDFIGNYVNDNMNLTPIEIRVYN